MFFPVSQFSSRSFLVNPQDLSKLAGSWVDFCLDYEVLMNFGFVSVLLGYSCVRVVGCFGPLQTQSEHWHD